MKKLFLIGNGFDLAHELPTRYNDLIEWYGKKVIYDLEKFKDYEDKFCHATLNIPLGGGAYDVRNCPQDFNSLLNTQYLRYKSNFFKELISVFRLKNWVDIENFYFECLKEIANKPLGKGSTMKDAHLKQVQSLNNQFQDIQDLLGEYLNTLPKQVTLIPEFLELFKPSKGIDKSFFLTFNYTHSLMCYVDKFTDTSSSEIINIHGDLKNDKNPIIFGYGDQHDEIYSTLENYNDNEFLRFIKYPKYTLSSGFQRLAKFINSPNDDYDVHIIGHSCGLSDRTLLREILENKNCNKIYIHYYPDINDFRQKATELTRHFQNKIDFLKKIQPYDIKLKCPQASRCLESSTRETSST